MKSITIGGDRQSPAVPVSQPGTVPSQWYNRRVNASSTSPSWAVFLSNFPQAHVLQAEAWGELKSSFGWSAERIQADKCGAQVLFRRLPLGLTLAYVPKGPLGNWLPDLLPRLDKLCRERNVFLLKIEPDEDQQSVQPRQLRQHGFRQSRHEIQPPRTLIVDLEGTEEEILARMRQKTRYNIGLAARRGVTVRAWEDAAVFGQMIQETAERNRFGVHAPVYYQRAYELFHPTGECELLVAEFEGQALAAVMAFARGRRAWYFYGASTNLERKRMPTYLLQWEAMRWARGRGCTSYDLWGVPDADREILEDQFAFRSDGLWGVYRFKRGFGGKLARSLGAWDRPYKRSLDLAYRLYLAWPQREP